MVTLSPLKFLEFIVGLLLIITGGMVSLRPPVGATILAHLGKIPIASNSSIDALKSCFKIQFF